MIYYIYIIRCSGDRLYAGYTSDPLKRFNEHKTGKGGAKFTRGFKPVSFEVIWEISGSKGDAMRVESFIKSRKRSEKLKLIAEPVTLHDLLNEVYPQIDINVSGVLSDIKQN